MNAYDELADLMMQSLASQLGGWSRDQVMAAMRAQFPDEAQLRAFADSLRAQAEAQVAAAQASLPPGHELAIAYAVEPQRGSTH